MQSKPFIIGITGGTGAGKTRLVGHLKSQIPSEKLTVITQDNYYLPRDHQPLDKKGIKNFDTLESLDSKQLESDIHRLLNGIGFKQKVYNFNNPNLETRYIGINPAPIVIVEGLFALCYPNVFDLLNMTIFVETNEENMLKRRILRDFEERGYDQDDVIYRFKNHFLPAYKSHVLPLKNRVTVTIQNDGHFDEAVQELEDKIMAKISF